MVTCISRQGNETGPIFKFQGLSSDTKPLKWKTNGIEENVGNMSQFFEVDTALIKKFNGDTNAWDITVGG